MAIFEAAEVPAARVAEFHDLPDDPQVLANGMALPPGEDAGMARVIRDPINVDGVGRVGARPFPGLGEHTDAILGELGYSADEVAKLRESGIV